MQQFNIDISQPRGPLVIYASQADSYSRFFEVTMTDNGAPYTPPAGSIFTVRFGAPGMPAGWYDTITEVGGGTHPAVVADKNTYTVEIAEQAVSKPGQNTLVLIVSDATGYTLASWAFALQVAAVPGYDAPEATVYYNALTEQVAQVLTGATAAAASAWPRAGPWAVLEPAKAKTQTTPNIMPSRPSRFLKAHLAGTRPSRPCRQHTPPARAGSGPSSAAQTPSGRGTATPAHG